MLSKYVVRDKGYVDAICEELARRAAIDIQYFQPSYSCSWSDSEISPNIMFPKPSLINAG